MINAVHLLRKNELREVFYRAKDEGFSHLLLS